MTKPNKNNKVILSLYSDDLNLFAQICEENGKIFVDFYKDEILVDSRDVSDHSIRYAEDIAENYVLGIIKLDPKTWRVNGV